MTDFAKHPDFIVQQKNPFNGEPPLDRLIKSEITPLELFFARNHAPVPDIDPKAYRLRVQGRVQRPLSLSLQEIYAFPKTILTAALQCAGNRRIDLIRHQAVPGEVPWQAQAIGNASWSGVSLRALLEEAGLRMPAAHVAFVGLDGVEKNGRRFGFGGSVPLDVALHGDVLLAYEMNGQPLTPVHGFPLRVVSPGYIGARSVKWLSEIAVSEQPSENHYQALAYKLFPPHVTAKNVDWSKGIMLGELSINAAICSPADGDRVPAGPVEVAGYAMAGGGRLVERVDVSTDGGDSWVEAKLSNAVRYAWRLWRAELNLAAGECELIVRAWDSATNTQPERVAPLWNFKGYMNNAWHRVRVRAV